MYNPSFPATRPLLRCESAQLKPGCESGRTVVVGSDYHVSAAPFVSHVIAAVSRFRRCCSCCEWRHAWLGSLSSSKRIFLAVANELLQSTRGRSVGRYHRPAGNGPPCGLAPDGRVGFRVRREHVRRRYRRVDDDGSCLIAVCRLIDCVVPCWTSPAVNDNESSKWSALLSSRRGFLVHAARVVENPLFRLRNGGNLKLSKKILNWVEKMCIYKIYRRIKLQDSNFLESSKIEL